MKYYGKVLKMFLKKIFLFQPNHSRNILKTFQKYFTKGYKESFQKSFLHHCQKRFSKVFATYRTWSCRREKTFQEMLLQDFTKLSRNFSCQISLKKPFMKYYEKHAKKFHVKYSHEIENVKKYFRNLAKIFHERF